MNNFTLGGVVLNLDDFGVDSKGLDLVDRSSRVAYVYTANATLITLVGTFVGLRIFVRSYFLRRLFLDDGTAHFLRTYLTLTSNIMQVSFSLPPASLLRLHQSVFSVGRTLPTHPK